MDHLVEASAGSLAGLNAWQALANISAAIQALASAHLEAEHCSAESPVLMPHRTLAPALISQARSAAVGTRYRPVYRADIVIVPPFRSMLLISNRGKPKNDL